MSVGENCMSVRGNLAENLRRLCLERGSINAACRAMDINRQQFDRYLTMQSTPSPTTLKKLCKYFGLEEQELFADPLSIAFHSGKPTKERLLAGCKDKLEPLFNDPAPSLKPGIYYTWMTIPGMAEKLVCAATFLRKDGEQITFRRITGAGEQKKSIWTKYTGDHTGIVVERFHCFLFSGVNQTGAKEPTLLRLRWMPINVPILGGHGLIMAQTGPAIATVIMYQAPESTTFRNALRNSRVFSTNEPHVDSLIASCIEQQRQELMSSFVL